MKKLTVLFASALLALALVAPASAGPVTEWNWAYNAGFSFVADTWSPVGTNINKTDYTTLNWDLPSGGTANLPQTIYWGTQWSDEAHAQVPADNPSKITLSPIEYGDADYTTIVTDGPDTVVSYSTHYNFEVAGPTLTYGIVKSTFLLTPVPTDPGASSDPAYVANLEFVFFETPNVAPDGYVGDWISDDVFILLSTDLTSQDFWYDGYHYIFNFEGSYDVIDSAYIAHLIYLGYTDLDVNETYYGWVTAEGEVTTFASLVNVTQVVPEPSTFILLGAGLLGLAGIARRRRS